MPSQVRVRDIKRILIASVALLVSFHLLGQFSAHILGRARLLGFVGQFRMQSEHNVPTYFSGLLLGSAALLLLAIAIHTAHQSLRKALPWLGLSAMFGYLMCDEVLSIHERFNFLGESISAFDALNYKWVVTGAVLVLAVVAVFFRFWLGLPKTTRLWFAIAAVVFVAGAIGFETLSGLYAKTHPEDFGYALLVACEEGMEMIGVVIFIIALARYIQPRFAVLGIQITDTHKPAASPGKADPLGQPRQAEPASRVMGADLQRS